MKRNNYYVFVLIVILVKLGKICMITIKPQVWWYSQLFCYVGIDPTSTVYHKQYQEYQSSENIFEILVTPKIFLFCTLTLRNTLKFIETTSKISTK